MSESIKSGNLIVDDAIAVEVAYPAKDQRSIAAAKRRVDSIVAEASGAGQIDLNKAQTVLAKRLLGAYAIYPEVFDKLFHPSDPEVGLDYAEFPEAVSQIIQSGGLPTRNIVGEGEDSGAKRFDKDADTIETATEALLVHPPTQDFLRDFDLGRKHYLGSRAKGYEFKVTVKDVTDLVSSAEYFDRQLEIVGNNFTRMIKYYNQLDTDTDRSSDKLQRLLYMLERVSSYMPYNDKDHKEEFENQVRAAKNSEETKIGDLKKLYESGTAKALELIKEARDRNQAIFDDVVSGVASGYKTLDIDTAETV